MRNLCEGSICSIQNSNWDLDEQFDRWYLFKKIILHVGQLDWLFHDHGNPKIDHEQHSAISLWV